MSQLFPVKLVLEHETKENRIEIVGVPKDLDYDQQLATIKHYIHNNFEISPSNQVLKYEDTTGDVITIRESNNLRRFYEKSLGLKLFITVEDYAFYNCG